MDFMMDEITEERYQNIFDNTYLFTKKKLEEDEDYNLTKLEALLASLYVAEGNDQLGRGELCDMSIGAQIGACELLLSEYKALENKK